LKVHKTYETLQFCTLVNNLKIKVVSLQTKTFENKAETKLPTISLIFSETKKNQFFIQKLIEIFYRNSGH